MKVNLSYSVELGEVLLSTQKLYLECKQKFEKNYNILTTLPGPAFTNAKLESTMRNLQGIHGTIAEFAIKLDEIHNMLTGYQEVLNTQLDADPHDDAQEAEDFASKENEEASDE